ncbi:MAG TPA: hypothetical protein VFD32_13385 [Dehalococcoidia bacterium]|nr:hypothetical protein [Dehalococcoidia bacterium]
MRVPSAGELIDLWERALPAPRPVRAAMLVSSTVDSPLEETLRLPLGQRDAALLRLRAALFGDALTGLTSCPACGLAAEFTVSCAALADAAEPSDGHSPVAPQGRPQPPDGHSQVAPENRPQPSDVDDRRWRLPNSRDLLAIADCHSVDEAAATLAQRCTGTSAVSSQERAELAAWIAAADPLAECLFDVRCLDCDTEWQSPLDIAEYAWAEISAQAQRLLSEVDALARAYGWPETEVLRLSPTRRAAYLRMVRDE